MRLCLLSWTFYWIFTCHKERGKKRNRENNKRVFLHSWHSQQMVTDFFLLFLLISRGLFVRSLILEWMFILTRPVFWCCDFNVLPNGHNKKMPQSNWNPWVTEVVQLLQCSIDRTRNTLLHLLSEAQKSHHCEFWLQCICGLHVVKVPQKSSETRAIIQISRQMRRIKKENQPKCSSASLLSWFMKKYK